MYIPTKNLQEIVSAVKSSDIQTGDVVVILIGEKNKPDLEALVAELNQNEIEFVGGVFPAIIHDDQKYEEGIVFTTLPALEKPFLITDLNTEQVALPDFGQAETNQDAKCTAVILVDGLTSGIASFLAEVFNRFGDSVSYFGGGAGSLSLQQEPCVFTPAGVFQDAAIVTFVPLEISLGVQHGWQKIMGPLVATKTYQNVIVELNWRNAFEVYREVVETDSGATLTREDFFNTAKGYPFGIYKEEAEDIVRDPIIATEAGELVCVGEVPENAALNIFKGDKPALVRAAGQAADHRQYLAGRRPQQSLVIDCISRVLFLEEDFSKELAAVKQGITVSGVQSAPVGALTLGEISSDGNGFLEFYNKTIVVGMLYG
jgi:hypothetical protein